VPPIDSFAQRAVRGDVNWRIWERALVMLWSVALLCGLSWALGLLSWSLEPTSARAAGPVPAYVGGDLAGRWKGQPMGYLDPAKVCGAKGCELTLDIVRCADKWCGIRVEAADKCGSVALSLTPHNVTDPKVRPDVLDGKLELADGTQPYVIEAVLRPDNTGAMTQLTMVGDTGPELMVMRRSFPFRAVMARTGDSVCKLDKPAV
jgi:hypothetical protein